MGFPDSFLEEVRRSADIVALIGEHVSLRKAGSSWKGRCPFHDEKTPSFNVRQEPPLFHCFGCGVGGDVFKFVMLREQASFPEAVEAVARRFGVPIPERSGEPRGERRQREELLELLEAAAEHYQRTLWTPAGTAARQYLTGRGFREETLRRIRAGAARDDWRDLLGALRPRYSPALLVTAGLALERRGGDGHYDRFRNRAVFPIVNESGKVVGFGARSLDGSEPKYLNSPETPVYQKGRVLYGLSWAREASRTSGRIVLMEGYLDVARALECGVEEAVATCGTALTAMHARLLHRFTERVVLNFDQDEAGLRASRRSGELLLGAGLEVRVVALPDGHDPDSFLKEQGAAEYRRRLDAAPHYVEWLAERAAREHDTRTPPGKAAYFHAVEPALRQIQSDVERAAWLRAVADRGGLDPVAAERELRRGGRAPAGSPAPRPAPPRPLRLLPVEKWLLSLILQGAPGVDEALGELADGDCAGLGSEEALRAARAVYLRGAPVTAEALAREVRSEEARRLVTETAVSPIPTERVTPADCVRELKGRLLEARIAEIRDEVRRSDATGHDALLQEQLQLRQRLANLYRQGAAASDRGAKSSVKTAGPHASQGG